MEKMTLALRFGSFYTRHYQPNVRHKDLTSPRHTPCPLLPHSHTLAPPRPPHHSSSLSPLSPHRPSFSPCPSPVPHSRTSSPSSPLPCHTPCPLLISPASPLPLSPSLPKNFLLPSNENCGIIKPYNIKICLLLKRFSQFRL